MSEMTKKILEEIHPLDIIREVQKRPALYAKNSPERGIMHFKVRIWNEIAKELFPNWDLYPESDKSKKIMDLMKKWRNLRDTWKRQVETEKKIREGQKIKKKVYVYYNHMSFLLPHLDDSEPDDSSTTQEAEIPKKRKLKLKERPQTKREPLEHPAPEPSYSSVYLEEIDEDKHFLMSLIPSFRRMTDDEKLTVKLEILKAIQAVKKNPLVDAHRQNGGTDKGNVEIKKELCAEFECTESDFNYLSGAEDESD